MDYHSVLTEIALKKHNITSDATKKDPEIDENIKARERYLKFIFLSGTEKLRYKQFSIELKNNYIMGMGGHPQDLMGVIKLLNNYIAESGKNKTFGRYPERIRRELHLIKANRRM